MKKRHLFGLFAMAAFAFVGCSQDEVVSQSPDVNKAIEFGTYVGRDAQSRAEVIEIADLAEEGFGVFAYYTGKNDFTSSATPNFMYNQQVTGTPTTVGNNTTYGWTYSPLKYWPNNEGDMLTFFAYAPHKSGVTLSTGFPSFQFSVSETVTDQEDLLWAAPHVNLTKNNNTGDVDDAIKFEFKHALSRIGFDVQTMIDQVNGDADGTSDDDTSGNGTSLHENTTVVVKEVVLSGSFIKTGTLAWTEATTGNNVYTAAITGSPESASYTLGTGNFKNSQNHSLGAKNTKLQITGQSVNETEVQLNADDSYIMIIPKNFTTDDNLTIKVTYDVVTSDGNLDSGYSQVTNVISTSFTGINFQAGKAYKFSLHLGLTSVKLTADVTNWITTDNPEIDNAVNVPLNIADNDQ